MEEKKFVFDLFPSTLAIGRQHAKSPFPGWVKDSELIVLIRTPEEVCVICAESVVPKGIPAERGMRALKIRGPLELSMVGVMASVSKTFADANIPIFTISTYDTDYFLIHDKDLDKALAALYKAGHTVVVLKEKGKFANPEQ